MPMRSDVPKYNPEIARELEDEGLDPNDAARQAATTMDGANETETGEIRSTQTNCDYLRYKETLPEPEEVREGRHASENRIRKEFGLSEDKNIHEFVDHWLKKAEEKNG